MKKLSIAETDISEFTVAYNYDRDPVISGAIEKTVGNAKYAAGAVVRKKGRKASFFGL